MQLRFSLNSHNTSKGFLQRIFSHFFNSDLKVGVCVYLVLSTHTDSPQQPLLLFTEQAINFPHGWEIQLI